MSADALTIETFAEYGIGMLFLLVRLYARLYVGGLRGLRLDDVFAVSGMIFWSMLTAIIYLLGVYGNNIGLNEQTAMLVPDSKIPHMILGSKLAFMNWIWYICYIWCLKGVLLCLYWKLTEGTWHRHLVTAASAFCVVTWLICLLTHICLCTPVTQNWQIKPYAGGKSDACIILIPIPILAKLQIPLQRKIILVVMFSSGIFIMISTILRAYYSLSSITNLGTALGWADRECFVAAIVVSLPGIKPLFRNTRWLGSSNRKHSKNPYYHSDGYNATGSKTGKTKTFVSSRSRKSGGFELDDVLNTNKGSRVSDAGSEEYILEGSQQVPAGAGKQDPMAIRVTTEYTLERELGRSDQMRS
ncbi:unnamed protein product [Penicillium nalgiovense]|uniref:Rhodopsin domain-containing protein n=2 Tax=Penicillium nalgiovense TaxID=60175 RepID=A0A9W4I1P1_PENNA|nr:unnamed protein product [Penicillium nalgiovense]CAG8005327.1 unnamed protein product [Penicillium nalgiovense]CAG8006559.1 unnamed protein product [Penicillium nalgiovense]CAG8018437.1 unnamed protein product [Penicillium nalgiovense]CAG8060511.1 unnamed protein product [Penicillium nalgiovense]